MSKPSRIHAFRTAIRKAFTRIAQGGPESKIEPGYFIDLVVFLLALDAYTKMKGEADPHAVEAVRLLRRYQPEVVEGVQKFMEPLTGKAPFTRFRAAVGIASRSTRGIEQAQVQAQVLGEMLGLLRTRHDELKETFSDTRAAASAQKVANLAASESPETVLKGLATVPPASRLQMTRAWVKDAAKLAGVAPSETEGVIADAEAAKNLGDDLRTIDAKLNSVDPTSGEAASLQEEKQDIIDRLEAVVETSDNPSVVLSAAVNAASQQKEYVTKIGKVQRLSPDQERAMMVRGKGIIAAGAGSGKTKTLASKVVYHIDELGVPPRAIMATSFSRKSAAELRKRIEDYGAAFGNGEDTGLGTTHSIAAKLMREYGNGGRDSVKTYEQTNLVRLAMQQVGMPPSGKQPPAPVSLLPAFGAAPSAAPSSPAAPAPGMKGGLTFAEALARAEQNAGRVGNSFLRGVLQNYRNPSADYYGYRRSKTNNFTDPRGLTEGNLRILFDALRAAGVNYSVDTDPGLASGGPRFAAKKPRDKDKGLREKYPSFTKSANQWFNLGIHLTEGGNAEDEPLPPGQFKQAITKFKGRMISPSEAYHLAQAGELPDELGVPEAAVYAAYEYLKGPNGEQDFAGKGDFDDVLIDVSKMLLSNPRALASAQARFKVILVDEAQDLNRAQHMMFGLLAGFIDPAKATKVATVKKIGELAKDDGSMTADTYCFIGDDKQAIYEFRGADPEAFIDMSDLVEGGAGFKTEILKTNYRSGELIVQAANRLIAYNTKQIPMTCEANPKRADKGGIMSVPFPPQEPGDMTAPAQWLAARVEEMMELGQGGKKGYDAFGVGLRSNAEAYTYGIELLKKGIPFRAKANFFGDNNTKALLQWLTIADEGMNGDVGRINDAVMNARTAPTSMLGQKFVDALTEQATGNYLVWLQQNYASIYGPRAFQTASVKAYVDNLTTVANLKNAGLSNEMLLDAILGLQGSDGGTVRDALVDKVRDDDELMAELRAADPKGEVSEAAVQEQAMAPIAPLKGLLDARANITEAMKYVRTLQTANAKLTANDDPEAKGFKEPAVTLGTMHSWKGLEVENMFVPVVGGKFPRTDATDEDLASERRLAYVALTRGENNVFVMDIPTVRRTKQGEIVLKSQFMDEMCLPVSAPASKTASTRTASLLTNGRSVFDPEVMDAYLRGEDPSSLPSVGGPSMGAPLWNDTLYTGE
jgi:superfamily I DNA/RNA helicase